MTQGSHEACVAFVGIDWAEAKHEVCLQAAGAAKRDSLMLEHPPEAIAQRRQALTAALPRPATAGVMAPQARLEAGSLQALPHRGAALIHTLAKAS